jgi:glycosyltransferase involved in cell wall biosynthesis
MISVIIPAHNESAVIVRTLTSILQGAAPDELEIIVICNGCTDNTALLAQGINSTVRVIETSIASKTHALNLGDEAAASFPRVYLDADVVIGIDAIRALAEKLKSGQILAASPTASFDLSGCSWPVRDFYAVRSLLPSSREGIGGSGVYTLSEAGRSRFRVFPPVIADDGFVRIQFHSDERETLRNVTSKVFPPRTVRELISTKTRIHYGSFELAQLFPSLWERRGESNKQSLVHLLGRPKIWVKLFVYCLITISARRRAMRCIQKGSMIWERDQSSRSGA